MHLGQPHISDKELSLSVSGEISPERQITIDRHLQGCWECRTRLPEMQNAISDFIHAYHAELNGSLPLPERPRALLRAKLEQIKTRPGESMLEIVFLCPTDSANRSYFLILATTMFLLVMVQHNSRESVAFLVTKYFRYFAPASKIDAR
jgi:hypothetical protein